MTLSLDIISTGLQMWSKQITTYLKMDHFTGQDLMMSSKLLDGLNPNLFISSLGYVRIYERNDENSEWIQRRY